MITRSPGAVGRDENGGKKTSKEAIAAVQMKAEGEELN